MTTETTTTTEQHDYMITLGIAHLPNEKPTAAQQRLETLYRKWARLAIHGNATLQLLATVQDTGPESRHLHILAQAETIDEDTLKAYWENVANNRIAHVERLAKDAAIINSMRRQLDTHHHTTANRGTTNGNHRDPTTKARDNAEDLQRGIARIRRHVQELSHEIETRRLVSRNTHAYTTNMIDRIEHAITAIRDALDE